MLFQEVISEQKSISKILEWHYLCIFFSPLQDPICRCPEYLWVQKSIIQPGYLIQGMSSCQKAFYIRALCWKFCFGNEFWNRKSWNENKEQKWICKIIRRLKKKKKSHNPTLLTHGQPFFCQLRSHCIGALFLQLCLEFGFHFSLSLSLSLRLPRPAGTRRDRHFDSFVTLDRTEWSTLAVPWSWPSWAQNYWEASVLRPSDLRGSEDGCSRNGRTSGPTSFLCWPMIRM